MNTRPKSHLHPAARQLVKTVKERIAAHIYGPGEWLPTERALSEEFGVDRSIIRSALTALETQGLIIRRPGHRPVVADPTHPEGVHTDTTKQARSLQTIAAILPQQSFFPSSLAILEGLTMTMRLKEAPYRLQIYNNHGVKAPVDYADERRLGDLHVEPDWEKKALEEAEHDGVAGIVLWHMGGASTLPQIERLRAKGVRVIFTDRYPQGYACDFVGIDNRRSAREAVSYLFQLGHRRIGHVVGRENVSAVNERREGYREALVLEGITPRPEWICYRPELSESESEDENAEGWIDRFLAQPSRPTAVFVANDYMAYRFITHLEAQGVRVPEDISVIGFDDIDRFSPRPAMLTTMRQPFDLMGQRAGELLLERLADPIAMTTTCQHIVLPTPLIVRSTCRSL